MIYLPEMDLKITAKVVQFLRLAQSILWVFLKISHSCFSV